MEIFICRVLEADCAIAVSVDSIVLARRHSRRHGELGGSINRCYISIGIVRRIFDDFPDFDRRPKTFSRLDQFPRAGAGGGAGVGGSTESDSAGRRCSGNIIGGSCIECSVIIVGVSGSNVIF